MLRPQETAFWGLHPSVIPTVTSKDKSAKTDKRDKTVLKMPSMR